MSKEFIYFVKMVGIEAIKIGKTSGDSIQTRVDQLKTGAPLGIELIGFFETKESHKKEKQLHQRFAAHRLKGEWFSITENHVKMILKEENINHDEFILRVKNWIDNGGDKKIIEIIISNKNETKEYHKDNFDIEFLDSIQVFLNTNNGDISRFILKDFHQELILHNKIFQKVSNKKLGFLMTKLGYKSKIVRNKKTTELERRYYKL
jgi:hypothetical protein